MEWGDGKEGWKRPSFSLTNFGYFAKNQLRFRTDTHGRNGGTRLLTHDRTELEEAALELWLIVERTADHTEWFEPLGKLKKALDSMGHKDRTELDDAYQAASVEAALRREFYDRLCEAAAALERIREIVHTPSKKTGFAASGRGANDHYASDFDEIRKICNKALNKA